MIFKSKTRLSYISSLVLMAISSTDAMDHIESTQLAIDKTLPHFTTSIRYSREKPKRKIPSRHWKTSNSSVPRFLLDSNSAKVMRNVDLQNIMRYPNLMRHNISDPNLRKLIDRTSTLQQPDQSLFLPLPINSHISMDRLKPIAQDSSSSVMREEAPGAAGILLWSVHNGVPVVLIGERNDDRGWCGMGGSCDASDAFPYVTAARETMEETMGIFTLPPELVAWLPYHDTRLSESETLFRTYIANCIMVPENKFNEMLENANGHSKEYKQFKWVPITDIIRMAQNAISSSSSEGYQTPTSSSSSSSSAQIPDYHLYIIHDDII